MPDTILETIYQRRSVRQYTEQPVAKELITELLKAAMAAPSASNSQPLEFLVITASDVLDKIRTKMRFANYNAPAAIAVLGNPGIANNSSGKYFWQQDGSAAIENLMLAAVGMGLGTVWIGVHPIAPFERTISQILGLPEQVYPLGLVYVGYPAETPPPRTQYNENVIHWEQYEPRKRRKKNRNTKYDQD
ncbi:MAG: nitroreductase family protein [Anaerolineae bacterium]|nr:nitroreductase family protein [Anaerolineae bacterium]